MSLREREDGADDDAEPEDLPNLVRRCILRWTGRQYFLLGGELSSQVQHFIEKDFIRSSPS